MERSQFPQIYSAEKNSTRVTLSLEDAIAGHDRRLFEYLIEGKMLLIESVLMCVTESRVTIFCTIVILLRSCPWKVGICACLLSVHRDLYILLIRLNSTNSQGTRLKASCFPPATDCWWLLALSVLVFRCWCSCGGDENNLSTGIDNAEITSRPSRISPAEMAPKTVQVCLYLF